MYSFKFSNRLAGVMVSELESGKWWIQSLIGTNQRI